MNMLVIYLKIFFQLIKHIYNILSIIIILLLLVRETDKKISYDQLHTYSSSNISKHVIDLRTLVTPLQQQLFRLLITF